MVRRAGAALILAVLALAAPAASAAESDADAAKPTRAAEKLRLKSFGSCAGLIRYGRRNGPRGPGARPPVPFVEDFAGGPPPLLRPPVNAVPVQPLAEGDSRAGGGEGGDSGTNVQEAGVDEPDIVKTANGRIFAVAGGRLHAVDSAGPSMLDSLDLEGLSHQLMVSGDRLLVISQAAPLGHEERYADVTVLTEVDVSDPMAMKVLRSERIRGIHVSSRLTGHTARVVIWSRPRAAIKPAFRSRLRGWLPRRVFRNRVTGRRSVRKAARCRQVLRPASFSGTDTLTVLTVDLAKGLPAVDSEAVLSGGDIAYASATSLYVATPQWTREPDDFEMPPPERAATLIHRFDISDPERTTYRASGKVPGYLLNQFSLSEHKGVLRVASTEEPSWWTGATDDQSESRVTTLDERSGALVELGHAAGLGRGERIYAVRFIGERGYVVTFRETDPLYTLDLSKPSAPEVAGELKIRGYSAYLHPIDDELLIGVGQDADVRGARLGTQLSLFDVGDPARPRRLHQRTVGSGSSSDVEYDHHAFLWWGPSKLAVMPVHSYSMVDDEPAFSGAIGFGVERSSGISERGRASHDVDDERYPWPIERSFVLGGRLFTLSQYGLEANSLEDLAEQAFLPFPRG